jgi:glycosyltransferase involved in cell wall biosynthesis
LNSVPLIRVLALMEASSVTGPAKNLIQFSRWTRTEDAFSRGLKIEISVATICRWPDDKGDNEFVRALQSENIPVHVIRERYRFDRAVVPQIAALVQELDPQIVQTHMVKSHFLFKWTGLYRSRTWLAFQHGYTATDLKGRLYNRLDRWSLRSARRVISVCEAFVPRLLAYGVKREQVRILHNSTPAAAVVSDDEKARLRITLGLAPGEKAIVAIGRLSKEKGHADLLNALDRLRRLDPEASWKAVLVGNGPELPALRKLSASLGLERRIVFAGFHSNLAPFYAIADIMALPSWSEGSPNVLLEAMAAGVPVAATRAGGVPEIVSDGETALLVPVRDAQGLGNALHRLVGDSSLRERLSAAALNRVRQEFSPQRYMHSLAGIYTEVLALPSHESLSHSSAL